MDGSPGSFRIAAPKLKRLLGLVLSCCIAPLAHADPNFTPYQIINQHGTLEEFD
jgi:hypothetical protein